MRYIVDEKEASITITQADVFNTDLAIARLAHSLIKRYKAEALGTFFVDNKDVPEALHGPGDPNVEDPAWQGRWQFVLDEMLFAFEHLCEDEPKRDEDYFFGELTPERERRGKGLMLFAKYFQALWS